MKKLLLSILFVVAMVSMLFAQTPQMTYQAVIRDGNGQLLSNQPVEATVKVKVGESELFNQTYTETTNIHGLLTVTFGHADFATIDWANATISCEVKNGSAVYIAENFQPVTTVPLAIKAISESDPQFNASVAASITASDTLYWNHKLDAEVDGSVTNEIQVLSINKDTIKLSNGGFVKLPAVIDSTSLDDAYNHGHSITADDGPVTINGTDGFLSTGTIYSMGTIPVSGAGTRMMWYPPIAAFRAGYINGTQWDSDNVGQYSTAMGLNTTAKGQASTAMGCYTTASSFFTTAMGYNTTASGEASTTMGNFTTASGHYATAMGNYTIASGLFSTAMGNNTTASGYASTAMGDITTASGDRSTAMGYSTTASGESSTAMGQSSMASGDNSTAMGWGTIAKGNYSTAMGLLNQAQSYASVVLGRYNLVSGNQTEWVATDPLFVVGNGEFDTPSNALTVYKNGNMDVNGIVTATGGNSTNWNTAYGWGNHASAGYLTSYSETDPVFAANFDFTGAAAGDLLQFDGTKWVKVTPDYLSLESDPIFGASVAKGITQADTNNWNNKLDAEVDGSVTNEIELPTDASLGDMSFFNGTEWIRVEAPASDNMVLTYCNGKPTWTPDGQCPPEVGDFYEGGVVFYILQSGDPGYNVRETHGLVCAVSDQHIGAPWGCYGTQISATSVEMLTGATNTDSIVAHCAEAGAAKICDNLSLNTYTDWFLPSLRELELMYDNKATIDATAVANEGSSFNGGYYWSSSENGDAYAWALYFSNRQESCPTKVYGSRVRAVRAF